MKIIEGRFIRQTSKAGYFGKIKMEVSESNSNQIELINVKGWENEKLEKSWIKACEIGAKYALTKIQNKKYRIRIIQILGTVIDTNPTIIGTATIFGIWDFLHTQIPDSEIENLTMMTLESTDKGINEIPEYK
jgi:hypothetical protein